MVILETCATPILKIKVNFYGFYFACHAVFLCIRCKAKYVIAVKKIRNTSLKPYTHL